MGELGLRHEIREITLAQSWPVEAIRGVENDLGFARRTGCTLRRTDEHIHAVFEAHARLAGKEDDGMRAFRFEVERKDVPLLQNASALSELASAVRFSHSRS